MRELVQRLDKAKERVCTTYTKKYFTCSATSSQRSEGINSALKHRGLFKADLKKMNLYQMADHLVIIARTQFCKEVTDLQEAVAGNKAWGKFVNDHWDLAHRNISTITEAPKEVAEALAKSVPGVDVARGCKYFRVASGNKEAPAGTSYIVAVPCARFNSQRAARGEQFRQCYSDSLSDSDKQFRYSEKNCDPKMTAFLRIKLLVFNFFF